MYNTDRNADYNQFIKQIELNRQKIDSLNKAQESKMNAMGTLADDYIGALDAEQAAKNAIMQDQNQAKNQYMNTLATLY
jgi:outer membrane protein TolC